MRSGVGAPIIVDEHLWGVTVVGSSGPDPLPPDTEERISDFAELVATALANAATRAELVASRARIVAAADDARRRLERDLHDGAQQRLVSLGLEARTAKGLVPRDQIELKQRLDELASGLTGVSTELQEISRGIHPAILSEGGLGPALKSLARRSAVPVSFQVAIERRLSDAVEIAAYYVVAEALTNAVKHAQASQVNVRAEIAEDTLCLSIQDDGIGGADLRKGSGLIGLKDRVEALGGHLKVTSEPGSGTSLDVAIRLDNDVE
jgi:signal transduction histidine kinase